MAADDGAGDVINLKVAMVGDPGVGKTSLVSVYVTSSFSDSYVETLGLSFLEKRIRLPMADVSLSVWDVAGSRDSVALLSTACAETVAVLYNFDLCDERSLRGIRNWYSEVSAVTSTRAILVGTKFDLFYQQSEEYKAKIIRKARKYAAIMHAPLVFSSALARINVKKIFRLVLAMAFDLPPAVKQVKDPAKPLLEYDHVLRPAKTPRTSTGAGEAAAAPETADDTGAGRQAGGSGIDEETADETASSSATATTATAAPSSSSDGVESGAGSRHADAVDGRDAEDVVGSASASSSSHG